jgi:mono/diheme cytochrome c family protein
MRHVYWALVAALALTCSPGYAQDVFADRVRPLLEKRCAACHNPEAKMSGFDVTSREALMRGGKQGVDIVAGRPTDSRLFQFVSTRKMPPAEALTEAEVETLRQWIESGAAWTGPESFHQKRARAGLDWWALQPPKPQVIPRIAGMTNPIDAFLSQKLQEKGLAFAPRADEHTLIRRLHFAVTGLPPRADDLRKPFSEAMEQTLASPQYGERWGRLWLDVARFGETDGGEHNNERFTAWKYRDWVIEALNQDMPYDEFVRQQVAGDALYPGNPKATAATGFLVTGPWDSVTKSINKDKLMAMSIRQDELDDMITATMASFMGLTVNCARCHDHKFDPIPTRDYYRLGAVFKGVTYGERIVATDDEKEHRKQLVEPVERELKRVRSEIAAIEDEPRTRMLREKYLRFDRERGEGARRLPVNPIWNRERISPSTTKRLRMVITSHQGRLAKIDRLEVLSSSHVIQNWSAPAAATSENPVILEIELAAPWTVSEFVWSSDGVRGSRDGMPKVYRFETSTDGITWKEIGSSIDHDADVEVLLPEVSPEELRAAVAVEKRAAWQTLLAERDKLDAQMRSIPPLPSVHAAYPEPIQPAFVLERGSLAKPGEPATPGALSAIKSISADLEIPPDADDAPRRKALARWLTDQRNPLLARVMVNRVWFWHFGNGIVNTPSDFGYNGDRPSHPELLDWLAIEFMNHGWSLKWLQRQIMTSQAWQQSSRHNEKAFAADASNRLVWHMPLKRMDAEMLRDSILASAGNLNGERGGPSYLLQKKATGGSYMHKVLDNDGPEVWRRAVYRFVVRGGERIFLDSFDCPDPAVATPQRSVSNTPVQALTLLNNKFVMKQAGLLAAQLERAGGDTIGAAYNRIHQRAPSAKERELAERFISQHGLALYLRALWNTNEFVYVP